MKKKKSSNIKSSVSTDKLKDIAKGLSANFSKTSMGYPEAFNPFRSALSQIRLSEYENLKLSEFLEKAVVAKTIDELSMVVDKALDSGIRINACGEDNVSFSHVAVLKMHDSKFTGNKQENIVRKLALSEADFDELGDKKIIEICSKVQREVEPHIHNRLQKLREVGENSAIEGTFENVEIDNKSFHIEFSQNSRVDVAKVVEGARNLGLSNGSLELGNNIIKIGEGELEIKTGKNGERNYADISDNSSLQ